VSHAAGHDQTGPVKHHPAPPLDLTRDRVLQARSRMLFSHVPVVTGIAGGFAALCVMLVHTIRPEGAGQASMTWLALVLGVALLRMVHAVAYFRATDRAHPRWRTGFMGLTLAFSLTWSLALWMLEIDAHIDLQSALVGSTTGLAACGAMMLTSDRLAARLWMVPLLLSGALYCLQLGPGHGPFGVVAVLGFLTVLWMEGNRSHRRIGELLHLRYQSDHIAQARAQALKEAEELSQAKGLFLATMSHEMRTPLHGILGLSRMLRSDLSGPDAHVRMDLLQSAGQHLLGVINDVLDLSRLQAGRLELHPRDVPLADLVDEVTSLAAVNGAEKGLAVRLQSSLPGDLRVRIDPDRLRQVLLNLLGNAVKFTERGQVTLRLSTRRSRVSQVLSVRFSVQDTGPGIPGHEVERIFDAFHQVDSGFARRASGTGLGLSIARQICQAMGGDIRCHSVVGQGSRFTFTLRLPISDEAIEPAMAPVSTCADDVRFDGLVLLVEDNPVNAMVAEAELQRLGLTVVCRDDGQAALDWLQMHRPDVIFMDCHMPGLSGYEVVQRLRQREHQHGLVPLPVVALTASTQAEDLRLCQAVGMNDQLGKPFMPDDLVRVLRRQGLTPVPQIGASGAQGLRAGLQPAQGVT